ncbi:MAG: hypothetical protein QM711_12460 [Micropruina sp.]|uniref:hypothetical protein n=1 Tax=Micropruina sp. TaxID=2737536 RepID=UPI0039E32E08
MPRRKQVGNPLAAAIVGVVIAGMGVYLIVRGDSEVARVFGTLLIVFGAAGAIANLWLRGRLRR